MVTPPSVPQDHMHVCSVREEGLPKRWKAQKVTFLHPENMYMTFTLQGRAMRSPHRSKCRITHSETVRQLERPGVWQQVGSQRKADTCAHTLVTYSDDMDAAWQEGLPERSSAKGLLSWTVLYADPFDKDLFFYPLTK